MDVKSWQIHDTGLGTCLYLIVGWIPGKGAKVPASETIVAMRAPWIITFIRVIRRKFGKLKR
jgi:hypothetical protein